MQYHQIPPNFYLYTPTVSDVDEMIAIQKRAYIKNYVNSQYKATEAEILAQNWELRKQDRLKQLKSRNYYWTSIKTGSKIVGYGCLGNLDKEVVNICNMIVDPEFQGLKIGSFILQKLLGKAPNKPVELETVTAAKFYEKFGFKNLGGGKMRLS